MVLINELTVEQINAALLHLQRSKDEVVGGNKGTTIQNISISNSGGGGNNVDYSGAIQNLATNIEKNKTAIEKNASDIAKLKSDFSNIEKSVEDTLQGLADNGISDLSFDPLTKQLTITTNDGDTYQTVIEQDIGYLSYDSATNKLILTTGNQSQEITLPYINSSEKGSANGVATLDENGRVPYSQLPESAMEFLGQWNASTNTPHLADGTGTNGDFYIVSAGGTVNLGTAQDPHIVTFSINDRIVYEGDIAQWVRLPAGQVSSVNGQSGEVTLTASDIEYSTGVSIKDKIDANAVQADWNVSDTSSLAYIKNKPTIPTSPVQSDWNVSDTTSLAYIKNKPSLATVATSGSYTDLSNKPTIPAAQVNADWDATTGVAKILNKPTLATVATSGSYTDLSNKPTIPAAQIQSDWTQTNNACKDYIKNKPTIPTVIDVIEDGNQNAASSNAVANALDVPTDAVLHYSFDEVPDYPDGNADIRLLNNNTYNIQSTNYQFRVFRTTTITNSNGNALLTISSYADGQSGVFIQGSYFVNKIVKIKIKINSMTTSIDISNGKGTSGVVAERFTTLGIHEFTLLQNNSAQYPNVYITTTNANESANIEILAVYIGDGSYSTPIIDNANGQNNATNNGGIAVQGVSGKGAYFPSAIQQIAVPYKQHNSNNDLSISLWLKIPSSYNYSGESATKAIFATGAYAGFFGFYRQGSEIGFISRDSTNVRQYGFTPNKDVWLSLVAVYSGSTHSFKLYVNGELKATSAGNLANYLFGGSTWYIWGNTRRGGNAVTLSGQPAYVDDILMFERTLSETEVQALYLNKANTPKYYDLNNYELGNKVSMVDVSSGIIPVALCTGTTCVGKSGGCPLTFNTSTGELDARFFSGVALYVGQSRGNSNTRYDIALLNHSPIGTGCFNDIAYACCRTLRYNPVTCTLYACNICGNILNPNTWITVYSSEYAEIKEMGVSGLYCFEAICNCIKGQYLYSALERALYYAYGRTFLPSTDTSLYFPVLGRYETVDRDNKNMGEIINEIFASGDVIGYGVTGGWHDRLYPSQTSCVNTRCFQFMFSGQHIS